MHLAVTLLIAFFTIGFSEQHYIDGNSESSAEAQPLIIIPEELRYYYEGLEDPETDYYSQEETSEYYRDLDEEDEDDEFFNDADSSKLQNNNNNNADEYEESSDELEVKEGRDDLDRGRDGWGWEEPPIPKGGWGLSEKDTEGWGGWKGGPILKIKHSGWGWTPNPNKGWESSGKKGKKKNKKNKKKKNKNKKKKKCKKRGKGGKKKKGCGKHKFGVGWGPQEGYGWQGRVKWGSYHKRNQLIKPYHSSNPFSNFIAKLSPVRYVSGAWRSGLDFQFQDYEDEYNYPKKF